MMRIFWISIGLVLAACASSEAERIELAPDVEAAYREYLADPRSTSFAVSEDGRVYGYAVCEFDACWGNGARVALEDCEARGGRRCVIFD